MRYKQTTYCILLTLLVFLAFGGDLRGQSFQIKGTVLDAEKNIAIQNINIFLKDTRIGTVSNAKGDFSINLPSGYGSRYLYFTGIGYGADSLLIRDIQSPVTVRMTPETYRLSEIYVMPDSTLLTLLRRAYNRIPHNYPVTPTMYEGFYRESNQNSRREQADFVELLLSVYKDPYDKPSGEPGQVEILKSRKRQMGNTGLFYYGGPQIPFSSDVVLNRTKYITPRYFKEYNFDFNGIMKLGDQEFYEISFAKTTQDTSRIKGTMLIDKETLAYVQFDISGEIDKHHPQVRKREFKDRVVYEKLGDKWYFKYYTYTREDYRIIGDTLYGSVDYVTTAIKTDSVRPIPYEKRVLLLDIPVIKAEEYNPGGWTDYDILKNVEAGQTNFQFSIGEAEEIFNRSQPSPSLFSLERLLPYILRFYYELGISYKPAGVSAVTPHVSFLPGAGMSPFLIDNPQKKRDELVLTYQTFGYHLTRNIDLIYQASWDLFTPSMSSSEYHLGVGYRKNVKPTGRPLLLQASLMFAFRNYYSNLGKYDNPSPFTYKETKIDARKISFDYGVRQKALVPQIALSKSINTYMKLKVHVSYNWEIDKDNMFRIREREGGLFSKKKVTIPADDSGLGFSGNSVHLWDSFATNKWQAGIALVFN